MAARPAALMTASQFSCKIAALMSALSVPEPSTTGVYSSSDIAVLTPYTGQLQKLREKMRNNFELVNGAVQSNEMESP